MPLLERFENVTVLTKANAYFDGRVISHTVLFPDSSKKTLGIILPGRYEFGTGVAERMEIIAGSCTVVIGDDKTAQVVDTGSAFEVPAESRFEIVVEAEPCQYICSYLE